MRIAANGLRIPLNVGVRDSVFSTLTDIKEDVGGQKIYQAGSLRYRASDGSTEDGRFETNLTAEDRVLKSLKIIGQQDSGVTFSVHRRGAALDSLTNFLAKDPAQRLIAESSMLGRADKITGGDQLGSVMHVHTYGGDDEVYVNGGGAANKIKLGEGNDKIVFSGHGGSVWGEAGIDTFVVGFSYNWNYDRSIRIKDYARGESIVLPKAGGWMTPYAQNGNVIVENTIFGPRTSLIVEGVANVADVTFQYA